jgi:nitrite reductase/ring-hydroxylating ferredoxin subunit
MDPGPRYIKVARLSELGERRSKKVTVGDDEVALWRVEGTVFAINNVCAHQHFSSLHQGILDGRTVTCPMHGWTYLLDSGRETHGNGRVRIYGVRIVGDDVFVECPADPDR